MPEKRGEILVLLDTNALIMPFQFGVDIERELGRIFGGYRIAVPSAVAEELGKMTDRKHLKAARGLCARYEVVPCGRAESVDDAVCALALKLGAAVLTNDRALRDRLKSYGVRVVSLRGGNHLELMNRRL